MTSRPRKSPDEIKNLLKGPVTSIPTPFLSNGDIDWNGVGNIIEIGIGSGSGVILLTAGDSQYFCLSEDEIAQLTQFTIERTAGRALTIAATGAWPTRQAEAFAHRCVEWGADALMSVTTFHGSDPEGVAAHNAAIGKIIPVMLVGYPSHRALDMLIDEPNICCFKEDGDTAYAVETLQKYGHHWKIMTGGTLWRHLLEWPFGCTTFMDWSTSFAPHIGSEFYQALCRNDIAEARRITVEIERPLWDLKPNFRGGWQTMWRAILELYGVSARYLRSPQLSATKEDVEFLRASLDQIGLLPNS
ncbi:MAG: dihydrodipicolinate synthase family protein [Candidatus Latescibacteria bacterium]|nr:dihydrodipicolinate synthase family protein [Candidatus Latescibacterota bacterium]